MHLSCLATLVTYGNGRHVTWNRNILQPKQWLFGRYKIRDDLAYENLRELSQRVQLHDRISAAGTVNVFNTNMDDTLTWDFVQWVRTVTKMPVFVKVALFPSVRPNIIWSNTTANCAASGRTVVATIRLCMQRQAEEFEL